MDVYITGLAPLAGLRGIFLRGRGGCRRTIKFLRRSRSCLHLGIVLIRYTQAAVSIYVLCVCACVCVCEGCAYAWSPSSSLGSRLHTQHTHTQTHTHVRARAHTHTHNIYILVCMYVCMCIYIMQYININRSGFLFGGKGAPSPLGRRRRVELLVVCCPGCRSGG